jgi:hypothetical protein
MRTDLMTDQTAELAHLLKVCDAVVDEIFRQGVAEVLVSQGFDPMEMAKAVIEAVDGNVVSIRETDL